MTTTPQVPTVVKAVAAAIIVAAAATDAYTIPDPPPKQETFVVPGLVINQGDHARSSSTPQGGTP